MKIFLIQTIDNQIVHDFTFTLIRAVEYHKWYYGENCQYNYILSETNERLKLNNLQNYSLDNIIPVGTVEFVLNYLKKYNNIDNIKPINIPKELMKEEYLKRCVNITCNDQPIFNADTKPIFVKNNTKIKGFTNIIKPEQDYPAGEFLVSEYVYIDSEWRCFVFNNELVGLNHYLGDFTWFPDINLIKQMIIDYKSAPRAYTLDVGISDKGTFLIEAHNFYSVGLYGYANLKILPAMFVAGWKELIK